jgi:hypothetical protein
VRRAGPIAAALFLTGTIVLVLAEATWLRTASAMVLVASVGFSVYAIATPEFLEGDSD